MKYICQVSVSKSIHGLRNSNQSNPSNKSVQTHCLGPLNRAILASIPNSSFGKHKIFFSQTGLVQIWAHLRFLKWQDKLRNSRKSDKACSSINLPGPFWKYKDPYKKIRISKFQVDQFGETGDIPDNTK